MTRINSRLLTREDAFKISARLDTQNEMQLVCLTLMSRVTRRRKEKRKKQKKRGPLHGPLHKIPEAEAIKGRAPNLGHSSFVSSRLRVIAFSLFFLSSFLALHRCIFLGI